MTRIALIFGLLAGAVITGTTIVGYLLVDPDAIAGLEWLGYLVMFASFALVFVGVKRYRDDELGGVIRFGTAFKVGAAIALVASVVYVAAWEATLAATDYRFVTEYAESYMMGIEASDASPEEVASRRAQVEVAMERMQNPVFRLLITLSEILPVGLLVALVAAITLRKPEVLPA